MREGVLATGGSALVFAFACLVPRGGLLSGEPFVQVRYQALSLRMLAGQVADRHSAAEARGSTLPPPPPGTPPVGFRPDKPAGAPDAVALPP